MSSASDKTDLTARQMADLSALADGTLDRSRSEEVRRWIAASPALSARYERERRVVEIMHQARRTDRAPNALRARIDAARPSRHVRTRQRLIYGGSVAGALAAIGLALALILPAGTPGAPSVSQAAALARRGPAAPAPAPNRNYPRDRLGLEIDSIYFPNWSSRFGWHAVGQRTDSINGRRAVTVYYQWRSHRIAYTIVAAPALPVPPARVTMLKGTTFRTLILNGRLVVTWRRQNHTCVLSGVGVSVSKLHTLAAWQQQA